MRKLHLNTLEKLVILPVTITAISCGPGPFVPGPDSFYEAGCLSNRPLEDIDCDGVPTDEDNCPYTSNSSQRDTDGDGIGDACENTNDDDLVFSPQGPCYYMSQTDFQGAVAFFTEIAKVHERDQWIGWNGYPCDSFPNLQSNVPRSDCEACTEHIFDLAGWGDGNNFEDKIREGTYSAHLFCTETIDAPSVDFYEQSESVKGITFRVNAQGLPIDNHGNTLEEGNELNCEDVHPNCYGYVSESAAFTDEDRNIILLRERYIINNVTTDKEFRGESYHSDNTDIESTFVRTVSQHPSDTSVLEIHYVFDFVTNYNSSLGVWTTTTECEGNLQRE